MSGDWSVVLYNSVKHGGGRRRNITDRIVRTWRRSTRAIGGYWIGTCEFEGSRDDMLEMFLEGMACEMREDSGGLITWQGYIAEMQLTLDGVQYIRSMVNLANAVKCIYTRIGDTLLTNGGAESSAWIVGNGGIGAGWTGRAIVTQSTEWVNIGTYSCKIESPGNIEGAWVQGNGYVIPITAGVAYSITGIVNAVSGSWRISCNRADTDASLAFDSTRGALGEKKISITIPATNTYAGMVDLRITSEGRPGIVYADSFYMGTAAIPSQTGWQIDQESINEYGRCELALLEAAMTSAAANAKVATTLRKQAWPKTLPPSEFTLVGADMLGETKDKLTITAHGYCYTLANKYSLTVGTAAASNHVKAIINEAEFLTPASITPNALDYQIDSRAPIKHFQIIQDILKAGDTVGNRWVGGVYAGRLFDYGLADNKIAYRYRGGKFYHPSGGELEPWFAEPGHLLYLDDAPVGPGIVSTNLENDPHVVFVSEIEMGPATNEYPLGTLTMKHEDLA